MKLYLFNYLTRKKEIFGPINKSMVGLYTCGPTVYDRAHIGNLRTYIFEDILKKTLEYNSYKVKHVMNITDVDDKIIKKMRNEKKTLKQITLPYSKLFFEDIKKLNIKKADHYPRAAEHIKETISLVEILLKKGVAYKSDNGSVYFDVSKFKKYGLLSNLQKDGAKRAPRIEADEYSKKSAGDFALWKSSKPREISWSAPFGRGRPGWHIECSAMGMKYLGKTFDIHAGAIDLIFPHHENEIAQSEAATGKKFVNYWLEGEHLLVNSRKMAKSLGNFYTLDDIEKRGFNPLSFRYLVLNTHYRSKLNFSWEAMKGAKSGLEHLYNQTQRLGKKIGEISKEYKKIFLEKINNDLNAPQGLAVIQKLLKSNLANADKLATILNFDKILGLNLKTSYKIPDEVQKIAKQREKFRRQKEWKKADSLRQKAESLGWVIEDSLDGPIPKEKAA